MVMCSGSEDRTKFELLDPPAGCLPGDRVTFEGYPGDPDKQLNPKKKVNMVLIIHLYVWYQGCVADWLAGRRY